MFMNVIQQQQQIDVHIVNRCVCLAVAVSACHLKVCIQAVAVSACLLDSVCIY